MAVTLSTGESVDLARERAEEAVSKLEVIYP